MALPVALQLYSIRDEMAKDMREALIKVMSMGYDGVEFAGLYGHSASEIKALCAELGLNPISAHVPIDDMVKDPEGVVSTYAEIGCKYIVVPYVIEERRPGGSKFDQTIEDMKMIGEIAKKHGMTLLYHNHDFEFVKIDGKYGLDLIYERVPASLLETEIDTCWAYVAGRDPVETITALKDRVHMIHLKDIKKTAEGKHEGRALGEGEAPVAAVYARAKELGMRMIVESENLNPDGLSEVTRCMNYLRSLEK